MALVLAGPLTLTARAAAPDAYADVLPDLRTAISAETADELSDYRLAATLDPATSTLTGEAAITYRNTASTPLAEVYFRLYPNAGYYGEGALTIDAASVAGTAVTPILEVDETALRVDLPAPVAPGEAVAIDLAFTTTVPVDSTGSYGIFSRDSAEGTWILADWHPVLAVYEDGVGWVIDPATSFGDPTYAASSLYDVTIAAPADLTVVASGITVEEASRDGLVAHRFVAGPAREFTLTVDDDYDAVTTEIDGTTITVYTEPELAATAAGEATLEVAAEALTVFGERFGVYPFAELDLVQTNLNGALAVSWSGIIFLDGPGLLGGIAAGDATGVGDDRRPRGGAPVVGRQRRQRLEQARFHQRGTGDRLLAALPGVDGGRGGGGRATANLGDRAGAGAAPARRRDRRPADRRGAGPGHACLGHLR